MKKKIFTLFVLSIFASNLHTAEMPHQAQMIVHQQEATPLQVLMALHLLLAINQEGEQITHKKNNCI